MQSRPPVRATHWLAFLRIAALPRVLAAVLSSIVVSLPMGSALLLGSVLFLAGCGRDEPAEVKKGPEPRGPTKTEERPIKRFEGLVLPGKTSVIVRPGPTEKAKITGPENYIKHVTFEYEKRDLRGRTIDVLVIHLDKPVKLPLSEIEVTTPTLTYVDAAGPARATLGDFSSEHLTLRTDAAARITLEAGTYGEIDAKARMASRIFAQKVMVETAHLEAMGPSRIELGQVAALKKKTLDGGHVTYRGKPDIIN